MESKTPEMPAGTLKMIIKILKTTHEMLWTTNFAVLMIIFTIEFKPLYAAGKK